MRRMSDTPPPLRVGDRERRAVDERLLEAVGDGVLTLSEYDERSAVLWQARTRDELDSLVADLPGHAPAVPAAAPAGRGRRPQAAARRRGDVRGAPDRPGRAGAAGAGLGAHGQRQARPAPRRPARPRRRAGALGHGRRRGARAARRVGPPVRLLGDGRPEVRRRRGSRPRGPRRRDRRHGQRQGQPRRRHGRAHGPDVVAGAGAAPVVDGGAAAPRRPPRRRSPDAGGRALQGPARAGGGARGGRAGRARRSCRSSATATEFVAPGDRSAGLDAVRQHVTVVVPDDSRCRRGRRRGSSAAPSAKVDCAPSGTAPRSYVDASAPSATVEVVTRERVRPGEAAEAARRRRSAAGRSRSSARTARTTS